MVVFWWILLYPLAFTTRQGYTSTSYNNFPISLIRTEMNFLLTKLVDDSGSIVHWWVWSLYLIPKSRLKKQPITLFSPSRGRENSKRACRRMQWLVKPMLRISKWLICSYFIGKGKSSGPVTMEPGSRCCPQILKALCNLQGCTMLCWEEGRLYSLPHLGFTGLFLLPVCLGPLTMLILISPLVWYSYWLFLLVIDNWIHF